MQKTRVSQLKASKSYRERQKALGNVEVKIRIHYSLVDKFRALVAKFKEDNKGE